MKILCLASLLVCAVVQGANLENDIILPPGKSIETTLQDTHLDLTLTSDAVTEDDTNSLEADGLARNVVADAVADLLESFREVVIYGNDDIPPLDPLVVPVLGPYDYRLIPGVSASIQANNLRMEGLRWYVVDSVTFNAIRLSFGTHITIPWITITGNYDARARLGLINHRAGGNFRIFAHRIEFGFDMRMGTNILGGGHLVLRELEIKIDIHDTHVQITGMTGSVLINNFINGLVQNLSQEVIQSELENVSKMLSEELFDVINDILKDYTISDILGRN